jgi:hypothetical protein
MQRDEERTIGAGLRELDCSNWAVCFACAGSQSGARRGVLARLTRCRKSIEANGLQGSRVVRHDSSMKLDGSRIDSARLGACSIWTISRPTYLRLAVMGHIWLYKSSFIMSYMHTSSGKQQDFADTRSGRGRVQCAKKSMTHYLRNTFVIRSLVYCCCN